MERWETEKIGLRGNSKQRFCQTEICLLSSWVKTNSRLNPNIQTYLDDREGGEETALTCYLSIAVPYSPLFNPRRPSFVLRGCSRWRQTLLADFAFPCVALYHFRSHLRLHCFYTSGSTAYFLLISLSLYIFFSKPLRAFATKSPGMFPESRILAWR